MCKTRLQEIEQRILEIKKSADYKIDDTAVIGAYAINQKENLTDELDRLKEERIFILDRRSSWIPKTVWNVLVPIFVTVITMWISVKFK